MTKRACVVGLVGLSVLAGCSSSEPPPAPSTLASSPQASTLLASLRSRFVLPPAAPPQRPGGLPSDASEPEPEPRTLFPHGSSEGFERSGDRLVPRLRIASSVRRPAAVTLPVRADGGFEVRDTTSGLRLGVRLRGTTGAEAEEAEGNVVYRGGYRGQGAVVHRPHAEGTEDFVLLEHEPEDHALVYEVDVRGVAGLRLTSSVLEFLNEGGDPRLRMTAPLAVDAAGKALGLRVSVKGCAVDEKEALPWGREVVRPGAERCEVRVEWEAGAEYPLVVDPGFTTTGSLAVGRSGHTASVLSGDRVLVVGGSNSGDATNCPNNACKLAEVWQDGSFSNAGNLTVGRWRHTTSVLSGDRILVVGGVGSSTNCPDSFCKLAESWQNGSFSNAGSLMVGRSQHTASVLSGDRIVIIGGYNGKDTNNCPSGSCKPAELWQNGSFNSAGNLTVGRVSPTASVLNEDSVLIVGGFNDNDAINCTNGACYLVELWKNDSFFNAGSLAVGRYFHTASVLSEDRVLILGGSNPGDVSNCPNNACKPVELWQNGSFASAGNLTVGRFDITASLLSKDRVLIVGGSNNNDVISCPKNVCKLTEIWQEGKLAAAGNIIAGRSKHTASVLSGSRVLVVGGSGDDAASCPGGYCKSAYIWDESVSDLGTICSNNLQCFSGFCVEGFCCDTSCADPCNSCLSSRKADGSPDGTCGPIKTDTDPKKACPKKSSNACDADDLCDGLGACKEVFAPKDTLCGAMSCTSDSQGLKGSACDGAGTCQANQTVSCQGFLCSGGSCPSFCFGNANCAPGFSCVNDACIADNPLPNNDPCSFNAQCASGFCSGGLCAEAGAGGASGAGGTGAGGAGGAGQGGAEAGTSGASGQGGLSGASGQGGQVGGQSGSGGGNLGGAPQGGTGQGGAGQGGSAAGASGASALPPGSLGAPCSTSADCNALTCVDGVCCESSCSGPCLACSAAKKGTGLDGVCGPVAAGTDPDSECTQGAKYPEDCSADGMCDGQGACRTKASETTACGATVCVQGVVEGELCSGLGVCKTAKADCAPFKCAGSQCAGSCAGDGECVEGAFCNELTKQCEYLKEQGKECAYDGQCKTGHCADGVCCDTSCSGQCEACDSKGKCLPTAAGAQPSGNRLRCDSGEEAVCHGSCDGGDRTSCKFPGATTLCASSSCKGSTFSPVVCDGQGSCKPEPSRDCEALLCDETAGRCKASCSSDADCIPGAACNKSTGICSTGENVCQDDHTVKTAGGTLQPCKGRCLAGVCSSSCSQQADCAPGFTCQQGNCSESGSGGQNAGGAPASPAAPGQEEGGCGCKAVGSAASGAGWGWMLALSLLSARRRKRDVDTRRCS